MTMTGHNQDDNGRIGNDIHRNKPKEITSQLLQTPLGNHYLVIYPSLEAGRILYADFIKFQLDYFQIAILFLPHFDTTEKVREILISRGVDVRWHERAGSLTLLDFTKIIDNPYLGIPTAFGLKEFLKKIRSQIPGKNLIVIADMSAYSHLKKVKDLLEFESHSFKESRYFERWKQLCLYHKSDFNVMFTELEKRQIFDNHRERSFFIS